MHTTTLPASIGAGQTESFLLSDPAQFMCPPIQRGMFGRVIAPPATQVEQRRSQLQRLGLKSLVRAEAIAIPIDAASTLYPELAGEKLAVWKKFLPTEYTLKDYQYDSIPSDALEALQTAQDLDLFDKILVWTPEENDVAGRLKRSSRKIKHGITRARRRLANLHIPQRISAALVRTIDPMAVGIITDHNGVERYFQIVRWGESLLPMGEIKAHVRRVDLQMGMIGVGVASLVALTAKAVSRITTR